MSAFPLNNDDPYRVGFLLIDGFSLLTYASAAEPLRTANRLSGKRLYDIWNIPAQGARATASCGARVPANAHVGERLGYDLVLVVASDDGPDGMQPRLLDWLKQLAHRKIALGGLGAGPLILARAGLLRSRKMTLHWSYADALHEAQPELSIQSSLFAIDHDRFTCAGGTAAIDLMHDVIRRQHGSSLASQVCDWWTHVDVRHADSPQRAGLEVRYGVRNAQVKDTIKLMEDHLADPLDLPQLAASVGISTRQLNRLFTEKMGYRTMAFYLRLRLYKSTSLLRQSSMSIRDIVVATGFTSASHFSRTFKDHFGVTPTQVRDMEREEFDAKAMSTVAERY